MPSKDEISAVIRVAQHLIRQALRPDIDLDAFLVEVLRQILGLVPFDVGWLLLREGERVRIHATDPGHRGDVGLTFPVDDCISGLSMLRCQPINIPDLANMPEVLLRAYKASRSTDAAMRSELVVPLMGAADVIGALNVESRQPDAFDAHHLALLSLIADQTALAVELARSRQEAVALGTISLQLARETELPAVVRTVLEHALALIAGEFGQLLLIEGADLVVHYTTNLPPREVGLRFAVDHCVSGLAVQERKPIVVPDVASADYFAVDLAAGVAAGTAGLLARSSGQPRYQRVLEREKERIHAELAVPLWTKGRITGILNVETPHENGFSPAQRAELVAFGHSVGDRFVDALACSDERRPRILRALLDEALRVAATSFGQLLEIDGDELVIIQTTGGEPLGTRVPVTGSVSGQALALGAECYVPEVDREPRYRRYLGEEMKSELAVPLMSGDQVLGVLNLESPVPAFFSVEHARILQTLAGQAAVAIERARRTEIERLAAIGGLAGDIIHRLNNPIGALSGWLDTLQRKPFYPDLTAAYPYVAQFVSRATRDVARAKTIIQELRTELREHRPVPVELQPVIVEALERSGIMAAGRPEVAAESPVAVSLALPSGRMRVLAGPSLVGVFWNLFDNARKAMPDGGMLSVVAGFSGDPGWIVVEVTDTGVGIEPWRLPFIFEAGTSTTSDSYAPAHGLGLWWTRGQVESFGGAIDASRRPGAGTTFVVRLRAAA